jgi:hypothetical protein
MPSETINTFQRWHLEKSAQAVILVMKVSVHLLIGLIRHMNSPIHPR